MIQNSGAQSKSTGYLRAFLAAVLWGVSGTCAQFLFHNKGISPEWLVCVRLLLSGGLLLAVHAFRSETSIFTPLKNKKDALDLCIFGSLGMLAIQYTYFVAIKYSNASTATILQFIGPIFIVFYYSLVNKKLPSQREFLAIFLALTGTVLIATHGDISTLSINVHALFWGICSAVALAIYSILPIRLLNKYDATLVVGWGMLIGGLCLSIFQKPWIISGTWDIWTYLLTGFVIIFGSAIAFILYLLAVKTIGASTTSLLACAEPLSATLIAILWLNVSFGIFDFIGMFLILINIFLLTKSKV